MLACLAAYTASSAQQDTIVVLPGGVEMEFVWVEPGTFMMGADYITPDSPILGTQNGIVPPSPWELPRHQVTLTHGFYIGATEVTTAQWMAVMDYVAGSQYCGFEQFAPDIPVSCLYWVEAVEFTTRLNQIIGGTLAFDLPSEAQWEYAARAGTETLWFWGNDPTVASQYAVYWDVTNGKPEPERQPVATKMPNPWGLYDMLGNTLEWVRDARYQYGGEPATDPLNVSPDSPYWDSDETGFRVLRGGSRSQGVIRLRASWRYVNSMSFNDDIAPPRAAGFRVAAYPSGRTAADAISWGQIKTGFQQRPMEGERK